MDPTLDQLRRLQQDEPRVALATLVATRGTSPKKEGAKMWVGEGGRILGAVTLGGCVDARVILESEEVLSTRRARVCSVSLGDEEAWDLGLTCSGTLDVLIEPLDLGAGSAGVLTAYETIEAEVRDGRWAVAVVPLEGAPARLVVLQDGTRIGSLGDPALDEEAAERAAGLMPHGTSRSLHLRGTDQERGLEAFFEVHGPPATLVVVGAGAVAMPLVTLAAGMGLHTVLVDGRERFATAERFPDAAEIRVGVAADIVAELPLNASTMVVLLSHDYKFDLPVLRQVLQREVGYVGLLGSRRRGKAILDFLADEGISEEQLRRVRVPVGLDIGAQTAPEIALSILAEAVAARGGRPGTPLAERDRG